MFAASNLTVVKELGVLYEAVKRIKDLFDEKAGLLLEASVAPKEVRLWTQLYRGSGDFLTDTGSGKDSEGDGALGEGPTQVLDTDLKDFLELKKEGQHGGSLDSLEVWVKLNEASGAAASDSSGPASQS